MEVYLFNISRVVELCCLREELELAEIIHLKLKRHKLRLKLAGIDAIWNLYQWKCFNLWMCDQEKKLHK